MILRRTLTTCLALNFVVPLLLLSFAPAAYGAAKNFTADDQNGDPTGNSIITYLPSNDSWIRGENCQECAGVLDTSKVSGGTWHNASTNGQNNLPSINITFHGSAAYVFCIVQRSTFWTNLTMTVDGVKTGTYSNDLFDDNAIIYNEMVFSVQGLKDDSFHELLVSLDNPKDTDFPFNLLLFDRVIYTTDDAASSTSTTTSGSSEATDSSGNDSSASSGGGDNGSNSSSGLGTGGKVAIAISAIAAVAMLAGGLFYYRRYRTRQQASAAAGTSYSSVPHMEAGGSMAQVPFNHPTGSSGSHNMQSMNDSTSAFPTIPSSNYASSLHPTQYDQIPARREPTKYTGLPEA